MYSSLKGPGMAASKFQYTRQGGSAGITNAECLFIHGKCEYSNYMEYLLK